MISMRKTFHVVYDEDLEQWILTYTAADQAFSAHTTKDDAVQAGRELANNQQPSQLVIHKMDGTVQTEYNYGEEPYQAEV